jgi:hypothetical protein
MGFTQHPTNYFNEYEISNIPWSHTHCRTHLYWCAEKLYVHHVAPGQHLRYNVVRQWFKVGQPWSSYQILSNSAYTHTTESGVFIKMWLYSKILLCKPNFSTVFHIRSRDVFLQKLNGTHSCKRITFFHQSDTIARIIPSTVYKMQ